MRPRRAARGRHLARAGAMVRRGIGLRMLPALVGLSMAPVPAAAVDPVRLQLKWHHQFQFAGYYAAQAKGYYVAEGLEVSILEGGADRPPIPTVLRGAADFGVGDVDVLLARLKGEPLVVCAAIFQHSPYVLMSRRDRGIRVPGDLVGARVMLSDDQGAAQFRGMLVQEGIDPARVQILPQSWDLDDLVRGRVDAVSAYVSVEPFLLRAKGVEPALLRSIDYGVDFYGDTLFTTEAQVRGQPKRVAAFLRASLKGWRYALDHPEEIALLVSNMDGVAKRGIDRERLLDEAREMRPLILPDVVEIGHMNPGRWRRIAETFVAHGTASSTSGFDGLVYDPAPRLNAAATRRLLWLGLGIVLSTVLVALWNLQMRRSVRERTRALQESEEALRYSEEKFSKAFQSSPDGLVLSRLSDGALVEVNEVFTEVSGYTREEALGRTTTELGVWADPADRDRYLATLKEAGIVRHQPASFRALSGTVRDGLVSGEVIELAGERLALTTIRDVTELNKMQQRLVSIYDAVGDVLFLLAVDDDGGFRFESINKRFAATTGFPAEAVVGKRVEEVIPGASLPQMLRGYREAIERKTVVRWEETTDYPAGRRSGEVSVAPIFDPAGRCTHLVGAVHDVTERKAAEERHAQTEEMLVLSQKLEGIGRLAGGIAHDFNNILGVILGYGELMLLQIAEGHPARPRLQQVIQAANRAAGLTRQLLAFSRKQVMQPRLLDLGAVVRDMRQMLERVVGEDLEIEVRAAEGLGAVRADPTQVEQVIMNLVVNARDAMPKGGHLTIETTNVDFDETYAAAHPPAVVGPFVRLAVSDTGVGMDAETRRHMFEPFFTTKPPGEGTGLGLATVYGIVKQMGGYIWVYSEVRRGTTFKLYLPRLTGPAAEVSQAAAAPSVPRGDEAVLVVEDSEGLRDIRELLEVQGYSVLSAAEGEEALVLVQQHAGPIDLLLTDVVMPKLGGADLVRQVRVLRPEIRVLYMSGYTSGAISKQGVLDPGSNLLEKPFTGDQLARAVRRTLEAAV